MRATLFDQVHPANRAAGRTVAGITRMHGTIINLRALRASRGPRATFLSRDHTLTPPATVKMPVMIMINLNALVFIKKIIDVNCGIVHTMGTEPKLA